MKGGERCAGERRETEAKVEHFGLNMVNGKHGLGGVSNSPSLLCSYNGQAHHR